MFSVVHGMTARGTLQVIRVTQYFMSIKNFFIKKLAERQLKNAPKEQREMVGKLLENNPDLFVKMSKEVEHKVKKEGKDQMLAMMEVGKKYQKELQEALGGPQTKTRP